MFVQWYGIEIEKGKMIDEWDKHLLKEYLSPLIMDGNSNKCANLWDNLAEWKFPFN